MIVHNINYFFTFRYFSNENILEDKQTLGLLAHMFFWALAGSPHSFLKPPCNQVSIGSLDIFAATTDEV